MGQRGIIKTILRLIGISEAPTVPIIQGAGCPAPHEQYPEILHWQAGDEIRSESAHNNFWFNLISITEDGTVFGKERLSDHKCSKALWVVMRDGTNLTLKDRIINERLKRSNEYMDLLREFNAAFAELQERDRKLRLVG